MASIKTINGTATGEGSIDDATFNFGERLRPAVLREAVIMYEANKRQGTVNTLTRRFVSGTGRTLLFHVAACRVRLLSPAASSRLPVARIAVRTWPSAARKVGSVGRLSTRAAPVDRSCFTSLLRGGKIDGGRSDVDLVLRV